MIANKEIPSSTIYETENVIAILDLSQAGKGHSLIMPKKHYENILDVDSNTLKEMIEVTQKVAKAIDKTYRPDGLNILNNCKEYAGQSVMHIHFHVIPRYKGDNIKFEMVNNENKFDLNKIKEEIKNNI
jgi:histidine triad (HIT) family protein